MSSTNHWPYIRAANQENMKFLKSLLIVLLLMVCGLVLIGVFVPEVDDQFETHVDRPIIQVFAGFLDVQSSPKWVGGLERVERQSGFLAMPGSEFKLFYNGTETEVVYTLEVMEVIPMESVRFRLYNEMLEFDVSVKFKADGLSTDLDTYVQIKGSDFMARAFVPLMKGTIMDVGKDNLNSFKQYQEE